MLDIFIFMIIISLINSKSFLLLTLHLLAIISITFNLSSNDVLIPNITPITRSKIESKLQL
jgi:MFS-type transporter involved in bile tolerance (Atg22 family)